jgi:hypothetical protein
MATDDLSPSGGPLRHNRTVCLIAGAGHSGSTLLGMALGAHPDVFYAGEARKSTFLGNEKKPLRKRMCKVCGPDCRVWKDLEVGGDVDLYEALSRRTRRSVVVDSTKSLDWLEAQTATCAGRGVRLVLVFLGRDGRAVLSSRLRKYPETSAREHAAKWVAQMEGTADFAARFPGEVVPVRYEVLATRPEATLRRLAEALAIPFDAAMLDPFSSEQHPLGGNAGTQSLLARTQTKADGALPISGSKKDYYQKHPKDFVLDLRWRRELSAETLAEFEAIAGALNRDYAWDEPPTESA